MFTTDSLAGRTVHRGRTRLRDPEEHEAQLGAPSVLDEHNHDRPLDGRVEDELDGQIGDEPDGRVEE